MAILEQRSFSRDFRGLIGQAVLAGTIFVSCVVAYEIMSRKRRGKNYDEKTLGSIESWEFGYLYQGRSWTRNPSPPQSLSWPLSWVKEVILFPELRLSELVGVDAAVYCRFIRGCFWFAILHSCTTTVILLPIHWKFSASPSYSPTSMTRVLISVLTSTPDGHRLLWIHLVLLLWVSVTWILTLVWISKGAFRYRARAAQLAAERASAEEEDESAAFPYPQHPIQSMPPLEKGDTNKGLRLRTVMVTNIPPELRSEEGLKEYFESHMSRPRAQPSVGLTSSTLFSLINKFLSSAINRIRKSGTLSHASVDDLNPVMEGKDQQGSKPVIERATVVRKMTELASLLERRDEMMRNLETAHIRLARRVLSDVSGALDLREYGPSRRELVTNRLARFLGFGGSNRSELGKVSVDTDIERASTTLKDEAAPEDRTELPIRTLGPFVEEFRTRDKRRLLQSARMRLASLAPGVVRPVEECKKPAGKRPEHPLPISGHTTAWAALFSLPRSTLNEYQPLVHLGALFRGRAVPAIDYYATKVNYLTALIAEQRAKSPTDFEAASAAFVTFAHPDDARRVCKYLAVHPKNSQACLVTMAPVYEDLDWAKLMKQAYREEFVKSWIIDLALWGFNLAGIIPVSIIVGLASINSIATASPGLLNFLKKHMFIQEFLQSFLPTVLMSSLMKLVPFILLRLAGNAHSINTLSASHHCTLIRHHKFLILNNLVFFCAGVTSLESLFLSQAARTDALTAIVQSFPAAGPFFVGWFILNIGFHGGVELLQLGLPLFNHARLQRHIPPHTRAIGIRPRTFDYSKWLPNHVFMVTLTLVFAVLNPLLMPVAAAYYATQALVFKNQFLHVYAKRYEGNGSVILIRLGRYTLDGLALAQVIFMGFVGVNKLEVHLGLTAVMVAFTLLAKIVFTQVCQTEFEAADIMEAHLICETRTPPATVHAIDHCDEARSSKRLDCWEETPSGSGSIPSLSRQDMSVPLQTSPERSPIDKATIALEGPPLVVPHEKHAAWDDSASSNRPYDNPYYIRPIANHLWLPRNPAGIPNLDDTVYTFQALTSDPSLGQLGKWIEGGVELAAELPPSASVDNLSAPDLEHGPSARVTRLELGGGEEIALPPEIHERAKSTRKDTGVDNAESSNGRPCRPARPSIMMPNSAGSIDAIRSIFGVEVPYSIPRVSFTIPILRQSATHDPSDHTMTREAMVNKVIVEEIQAAGIRTRKEAKSRKIFAGMSWVLSRLPWPSRQLNHTT